MVSSGFHDVGEEYVSKLLWRSDLIAKPGSMDILLYEDLIDTLEDDDDIAQITSEASGGNYSRQQVDIDSTAITLSQTVEEVLKGSFSVTFNVRNTGGTVDAWAAVASFQSDIVNAESSANPHVLVSASLDQGQVSLAANDEITVEGSVLQE